MMTRVLNSITYLSLVESYIASYSKQSWLLLMLDVKAELRTFDRDSNWLVEKEKTPAGPYKLKLFLGSLGRIEVALNKSGLLEVVEVERLAGRKVFAIKFKKGSN